MTRLLLETRLRPAYTFGLNYGINYKGFFLTINWTGAAQRSLLLDGAFREPFGNGKIRGLMQFHADTRWTPETANTATTPRFTETRQSIICVPLLCGCETVLI